MAYIRVPLTRLVRVKKIITCFTDAPPAHYRSGLEKHNFWEMVVLRRGRMGCRAGDVEQVLTAGQAVLHAPNVLHGLHGDGEHPFEFFIISFECDSPALAALGARRCTLSTHQRQLADAIMAERELCFAQGPVHPLTPLADAPLGSQQMIALYLEQLLIGLLRETAAADGGLFSSRMQLEEQLVADICSYLEAHIYADLDMEAICAHFHYGKSRLCAAFRRVMGDSIMHWYHTRKLEEARRLLLESDQSVTEIAVRLHFDSPQYFSRAFTKHIGICPRDFRAARE
ncbi:MAG: helix-turn-helix domain-containing protein [Clostridia bacterium]|nr:helix-turn-helix domain-containing protein [Clostridia bacterium]